MVVDCSYHLLICVVLRNFIMNTHNLSIVFNAFVSERLQLALYSVVVPSTVYEDDARLFGYIFEILRCVLIMVFKSCCLHVLSSL